MRPDLREGVLTMLFTDIEGSTRLLHELGDTAYGQLLTEHHRLCRHAWHTHNGTEIDTAGDSFFVIFTDPDDAINAAHQAHTALEPLQIRIRIGIHTGPLSHNDTGYHGIELHRAARIAAAGHGGQTLLSASTAALVCNSQLTDLGNYRFKDIAGHERVFQLGERPFPPIRASTLSTLPAAATSFVGRRRELDELGSLLDRSRLVTITGPGGVGKTRLALALASARHRVYAGGVTWIDLVAVPAPELVVEAIGAALGAESDVATRLGDLETLIVLDNLEHLAACAPDISNLLAACSGLTLLVTSRERLRISGETIYPLGPVQHEDAVTIFCERAGVVPDQAVNDICERLECIPLALELAAGRVGALEPRQLLHRLDRRLELLSGGRDSDRRHRSLRATVAWSFELLGAREQRLLSCLSVLAGGWTLEMAEEICDGELDDIASLHDKSLIHRSGTRYSMLETVREYAAEQLDAVGGRPRVVGRLRRWLLRLAGPLEVLGDQELVSDAMARIATEHANVQVALQPDAGDDDPAQIDLGIALEEYFTVRGHLREASLFYERATVAAPDGQRRAEALRALAAFLVQLGEYELARRHLEELFALPARLAPREERRSHAMLGAVRAAAGEFAAALASHQAALEIAREHGDQDEVASALGNVACMLAELGRTVEAVPLHEEAVTLARTSGDSVGLVYQLAQLGLTLVRMGEHRRAEQPLHDALRLAEEIDFRMAFVYALLGLAAVSAASDDAERAARMLGSATLIRDELGLIAIEEQSLWDEVADASRRSLGDERYEAVVGEGRSTPPNAFISPD